MDGKTISFKALQRSRTTLEDFTASYFPLHGLRIPEDLFKHLDILVFVEATIYAMDEENELMAGNGNVVADHVFQGERVLMEVLDSQQLLDDCIAQELAQGIGYWQRERSLCSCMLEHSAAQAMHPHTHGMSPPDQAVTPHHAQHVQFNPGFTLGEVLDAHERKSFDYRVLHLLLFMITKRPYDEQLLAAMRVDEMLVDIGDDLVDYEDDVVDNSFNIYRGYIHLYGSSAQGQLIKRISELEAERARLLAALPQAVQQQIAKRQEEAVTEPGADRWIFPEPILPQQENSFREEMRRLEAAA